MDERGGFARSAEEIHAALADAEAGDKDREITALRAERDEMLSRLNKLYLHTAQPGSPPPGDLITGIGFNFTALRAENTRLRVEMERVLLMATDNDNPSPFVFILQAIADIARAALAQEVKP